MPSLLIMIGSYKIIEIRESLSKVANFFYSPPGFKTLYANKWERLQMLGTVAGTVAKNN